MDGVGTAAALLSTPLLRGPRTSTFSRNDVAPVPASDVHIGQTDGIVADHAYHDGRSADAAIEVAQSVDSFQPFRFGISSMEATSQESCSHDRQMLAGFY